MRSNIQKRKIEIASSPSLQQISPPPNRMSALPPTFYIATWVNYHGDLTSDSKIFTTISSIQDFFLAGYRILSSNDEDAYMEATVEIPQEVQKYTAGTYMFHYSDMSFSIVQTTQEEFLKHVIQKLPSIGHILYV